MKKLALISAFLIATTGLAQAQSITCQRTSISQGGFTNINAVKNLFPERTRFDIRGNQAMSDFYGPGTAQKSGNKVRMVFAVSDSRNNTYRFRVTYIPKTGRYTANMVARSGYEQVTGVGGRCKAR